jgi:hypothetical protein
MNNLTKIAALPGSGAGCMASLPAEKFVGEPPYREPVVQMKAPYFEEPKNIWSDIDWGNFDLSGGGFGC